MFQRRRPIFQRVLKILKIPILRRHIIPRLKHRRSSKRVKLLQQYNYRFLQEYHQFSPSRTSLIRCRRKSIQISRTCLKQIYELLCLSRCVGRSNDEHVVDTMTQSWMEMDLPQSLDYFSEDDSIDLKAERFIEKFYGEMRMQAREFSSLTDQKS